LVDIPSEVNELKLLEFYMKLYDTNRKGLLIVEENLDDKVEKLAKELRVEIIKNIEEISARLGSIRNKLL